LTGHSGLPKSVIVQYWRSFEQLEAYARAKDKKHWPAWVDFHSVLTVVARRPNREGLRDFTSRMRLH
jgi:hypothetical protein